MTYGAGLLKVKGDKQTKKTETDIHANIETPKPAKPAKPELVLGLVIAVLSGQGSKIFNM